MIANGYHNNSDVRIKKDIKDLDSNESLDLIKQIKVKKYKYIDEKANGNLITYGFIAQELEGIIPLTVTTREQYIPSIYEDCSLSWNGSNTVTIHLSTQISTSATEFKFIINQNSYKYTGKITNTDLVLDEEFHMIDNIIYDSTGIAFVKDINELIFVYGYKVKDFKIIDKNKIFTVGISAIQELNIKNTTLENKVTTLENKVTTLETQLSDVLNRLTALENN